MKTKSIVSAVAGIVLAALLIAPCAVPSDAHAATAASGQALTVGSIQTQSTTKAPKPKPARSATVTFKNGAKVIKWARGTKKPASATYVRVSWDAPAKVQGLKSQTYTVRYADNFLMNGAKAKTTSKTSIVLHVKDRAYVQIRTNAKRGKETVYSKWATFYINTIGGGGSEFSNGYRYDYEASIASIQSRDDGKPGSAEAAALAKIPRSLKLSSAKLTSSTKGTVKVSWKAPKTESEWGTYYAIRYSYNKSMKNAKTVKNVSSPYTIKNLKKGKRVYVQVCAFTQDYNPFNGEWLDTYSQFSRWSAVKSTKMPSKRA